MILLVDHYDSFTYNLYALFKNLGAHIVVVRENRIPSDLSAFKGVILSPGPSHPSVMTGSMRLLEAIAGRIPVFGVCLGMQIIGFFLGYEVSRAKRIMHGKRDRIVLLGDSIIFRRIPTTFSAVRYHSLSVKIRDLKGVVAVSEVDGEIMAIEFPDKLLFGVQFHPESIESEFGEVIASNFLEVCYGGS